MRFLKCRLLMLVLFLLVACTPAVRAQGGEEPLPSWRDGKSRDAIVSFVKAVTKKGSKDFVKPEDRIAVFDNDGTLWCEKPIYPQMQFSIEKAREKMKKDESLKEKPVFKAALDNDLDALALTGAKGIQELICGSFDNLTTDQYTKIVVDWIQSAKHPRFKHKYTECVYQPMLEVLSYLRKNGFSTYIVSGGGRDFMRPWCESTYGIKPHQIVGTSLKLKYRVEDGKPAIYRTSEIDFLNDGFGKPVGIQKRIGKVPIVAFGNSNGDKEMLRWTSHGSGKSLCVLVHHTDAVREYAYDRESRVGHLSKALDEAKTEGWLVVDIKKDWSRVFSFQDDGTAEASAE